MHSHGLPIEGAVEGFYAIIALGFVIRWITEGFNAKALWFPLLALIFILCAVTRNAMAFPAMMPDLVFTVLELALLIASGVYAIGQLCHITFPDLMDEDSKIPKFSSD